MFDKNKNHAQKKNHNRSQVLCPWYGASFARRQFSYKTTKLNQKHKNYEPFLIYDYCILMRAIKCK